MDRWVRNVALEERLKKISKPELYKTEKDFEV
jgi:hypothetical protein